MLSRLPDAERLTAVAVGSNTPLGSLAASMMRTAASLDLPGEASASAKVGASLVDIPSATIELELGSRNDLCDRQASLLKRAKDYMRARLDEPELDVDTHRKRPVRVAPHTEPRVCVRGTTVIRLRLRKRLALQPNVQVDLRCPAAHAAARYRTGRLTQPARVHRPLGSPAGDPDCSRVIAARPGPSHHIGSRRLSA
jgi:hypothetical protein